MSMKRFAAEILSLTVVLFGASAASAQDYPNKPIRFLTAAPGGGLDFAARMVAQGLTGAFNQQMIVDNRGGSVVIPAMVVAKAPGDGYTLLVQSNNLWLWQFIQSAPYDPAKDFLPIIALVRAPHILVVHPSLPVKSVKELIALAKAKPGQLNYASTALAGSTHLAAERFKIMTGTNIVHIPYKGATEAVNDLIAGEVQMLIITGPSVMPHIKSGRLRALAVTTEKPTALAPGLPTVAASGVPGYELSVIYGMFAPAGTPAAIVTRLNQEVGRILSLADVKERFFNAGVDIVGGSPQEFAAAIQSDTVTMGKLIKDAGIKAN